MRVPQWAPFLACVLFATTSAFAQNPATGFPPFGSFEGGTFDTVNRQNLNVNFAIPIVSSPARGLTFSMALVYDSLVWTAPSGVWSPVTDQSGSPTWGWKTRSPVGASQYRGQTIRCVDQPGSFLIYSNYKYVEPNGTIHPFNLGATTASPCSVAGGGTGYATDNSGYLMDITTPAAPIVWSPSGTKIAYTGTLTDPNGVLIDPNGNFFSEVVVSSTETDWKDSVSRTALKIVTSASTTQYQFLDPTGAYQTTTVNYQTFSIQTAFGCAGVVEYNGTASLPISVVLPNGNSYQLAYEQTPGFPGYYTGRLQQVTLPTGGSYQYTYSGANGGINCADGNINSLTRVVNDGTTSSTWQFVRTQIDASNWKTAVTAPQLPYDAAANQSTFIFTNGKETSQNIYQGPEATGTLLRTINTAYAANGTPSTKTVIAENNQQMQVATTYDSNGLLQSMTEYDWGAGAPGSPIRTTTLAYLTGSAYAAGNIIDRVTQKIIREGGPIGTIRARTDTSYDGTALTCVTGAAQHNDTNYGCAFTARGNPTAVTSYVDPVTPSGAITKNSVYDSLGNLRQADLDCCQQKVWSYSVATQYAWPDSELCGASGGPQITRSKTYYFNTGQVATETDENNKVTTYTYDILKRLTDTQRPDGAHVTYAYDDLLHTETLGNPVQGTDQRRQMSYQDGLGRIVKSRVLDAAGTSYSIVETQYDSMGRPYRVSNPHNSTAQYWTETRFDALGRTLKVIPPDGSATANNTTYAYAGNAVTVTDPAGHQRKNVYDGAGRIASVFEPDVSNGNALTQQTSYSYTAFDSIAQTTQASLTRTDNYDGLGRLTSEVTPESGTVSYQYNNFSLQTQRTDARGVVTSYAYDTLNRPTGISYNVGTSGVPATPGVTYAYGTNALQNNNNRLLTMNDGTGSETYSYDALGRVTQIQKLVGGTTYSISRTYNYQGQRTSETYPSGRAVATSFDAIGRATSISSGSTTYVSALSYNPAQQITGYNYGNGVTAGFTFTPQRMQLQNLSYTNGAQTLFSLAYGYTQNGGNNGQITSITDNVDTVRSLTFSYDALGRLASGSTSGGTTQYPQWTENMSFDRYGSRASQTVPPGSGGQSNAVTMSANSNLIASPVPPYGYEARGNMTGDGLNALAYDAENRLVTSTGGSVTTYAYDGKSLRVTKAAGSTTTVYLFSGGKVLAEYVNGALSNEYIYLGDQLIATQAGATLTYHHRDHFSVRVNTDGTSGAVVGEQGHYPYGEVWYSTGTTTKYRFTSYERDAESGNDYAMHRFHASRLGRFLSPDPINGSPSNPQSLNRYAYTMNDPVNQTDPDGLCTIEVRCSLWPPACAVYEYCGDRRVRLPIFPPFRELLGGGGGEGGGIKPPLATCNCKRQSPGPGPNLRCNYSCVCGAGFKFFGMYTSVESYLLDGMRRVKGCEDASKRGTECPPNIESVEINIGGKTSYALVACVTVQ